MTAAAAAIAARSKIAGSGNAAISAVPIASPTPISPASFMADTVLARRRSSFERIGRWAGGAALAGSIAFIGERLWRLDWSRSEEHTSELQSLMRISYAVFCLKKKKTTQLNTYTLTINTHTHRHKKCKT